MDSWLRMFSPMFSCRMPASGDMWLDYRPWTNWDKTDPKAGNPEIEAGIFREIALPGKQLGKLTEAVMALADLVERVQPGILEQHPDQGEAIRALGAMNARISLRKEELKRTTKAEALASLERLRQADPEAYRSLLDELRKQDVDGAE